MQLNLPSDFDATFVEALESDYLRNRDPRMSPAYWYLAATALKPTGDSWHDCSFDNNAGLRALAELDGNFNEEARARLSKRPKKARSSVPQQELDEVLLLRFEQFYRALYLGEKGFIARYAHSLRASAANAEYLAMRCRATARILYPTAVPRIDEDGHWRLTLLRSGYISVLLTPSVWRACEPWDVKVSHLATGKAWKLAHDLLGRSGSFGWPLVREVCQNVAPLEAYSQRLYAALRMHAPAWTIADVSRLNGYDVELSAFVSCLGLAAQKWLNDSPQSFAAAVWRRTIEQMRGRDELTPQDVKTLREYLPSMLT